MGVYKRRRKDGTQHWEFRQMIRGVKYYEPIPEAQSAAEAKVAAAKILRDIYEGKYGREGGELGSYDFAKFVDEIYLPHVRDGHRNSKNVEYKCGVFKLWFKGKRLRDITQIEVEKFRRARLAGEVPSVVRREHRGKKPKWYNPARAVTVKHDIGILSAILNYAVENDYLGKNPCRKIRWRQGEVVEARARVATADEVARLLRELEGERETRAAVVLALNCGLRRMGILTLKEGDVDFGARTLAYTAKGGRRKLVPLNNEALAALRELVGRAAREGGWLFGDRYGFSLSFAKGSFKRACARAGIEGLNFHDLRRTFAERIDKVAGQTTARDLLGHATVQTTNAHYIPENFEAMRRAVEALSGAENVVEFGRRKA